MNLTRQVAIGLLAAVNFFVPATAGQSYPERPIRFVVPYAPGGAFDTIARTVGQQLSERLGETVTVDNRLGATGSIGVGIAANAKPDGYTILMLNRTWSAQMHEQGVKLPFDASRALEGIGFLGSASLILVVNPSLPVKSTEELVHFVRARPNQIHFANSGGPDTQFRQLIEQVAKVKFSSILYKGLAPAISDVVAGQAHVAAAGSMTVVPHVRSGKLRALAISGAVRSAALLDVPPIVNTSLRDCEFSVDYYLYVRAGTPKGIIERLERETAAVYSSKLYQSNMVKLGLDSDVIQTPTPCANCNKPCKDCGSNCCPKPKRS